MGVKGAIEQYDGQFSVFLTNSEEVDLLNCDGHISPFRYRAWEMLSLFRYIPDKHTSVLWFCFIEFSQQHYIPHVAVTDIDASIFFLD